MIAPRHQRAVALLVTAALALGTWRLVTRPAHPNHPVNPADAAPSSVSLQLDPNTATLAELLAVPGMGTARAQALISHRNTQTAQGTSPAFITPSDLSKVPGFGPATLQRVAPFLVYPTR